MNAHPSQRRNGTRARQSTKGFRVQFFGKLIFPPPWIDGIRAMVHLAMVHERPRRCYGRRRRRCPGLLQHVLDLDLHSIANNICAPNMSNWARCDDSTWADHNSNS